MSPSPVDAVQLWYHTLELPGEGATPGWFDLRGVPARLPWPEVTGRRCLDVATYDGFYAFELERRGAREVVATDIPDHQDWDWPAGARANGGPGLAALAGQKGRGFEVARAALGSSVTKVEINVYDLSPQAVGTFDIVVCGSLLLHLRDPVAAIEAIRSVCTGWFLSVEAVSRRLSWLLPRQPAAELAVDDALCQWWTVNAAGHRRLAEAAGFSVTQAVSPFLVPFGAAHPPAGSRMARAAARLPIAGSWRTLFTAAGVPHAALLAAPRSGIPPLSRADGAGAA